MEVCEAVTKRLVSDGIGSPDRPKWPLSRELFKSIVTRHAFVDYSDAWVAQSAVLTRISGASSPLRVECDRGQERSVLGHNWSRYAQL